MRESRREGTAAVVVLIDAHKAVIDRCVDKTLTRVQSLTAEELHGTSDHMGDAPRQTFHPGTRGETANDAAQRAREVARERFVHRLAPIVAGIANANEWVVIGGNPQFAAELHAVLAKSLEPDAVIVEDVNHAMSAEMLIARVTAAVEARRDAQSMEDVQSVLELSGAHTKGVAGPTATLDAAEHSAADVVLITPTFQEQHADEADKLVAATQATGGRVEVVTGAAADLLDNTAGGAGARLRFALHAMPNPAPAAE